MVMMPDTLLALIWVILGVLGAAVAGLIWFCWSCVINEEGDQ